MQRPEDLPDFTHPPLNEVVMGVQFSPPNGYSQIRAGDVWKLFRADYPLVQERDALPPTFETFGARRSGQLAGRVSFVAGPVHDRFWFVSESGEELVQFQQDRLLHNWRKIGNRDNEYPRFEIMLDKFRLELSALELYAESLTPQRLSINQCELSYINHIAGDAGTRPTPSDWLRFVAFAGGEPEDFAMSFKEIVRDAAGHRSGGWSVRALVCWIRRTGRYWCSVLRFAVVRRIPASTLRSRS
ncbi:MAG: TIGR04255 family protein [Candidatus Competibacteraceae bacterium]|nr:TIGR04255 family protein [Candidatus Competibacteraceae bacterium]